MTTKYSTRHSQKLNENEGKYIFYKNPKKDASKEKGKIKDRYIRQSGENSTWMQANILYEVFQKQI